MARHLIASVAVMVLFAGLCHSDDAPKANGPAHERERIGKLIEQLGSSGYAERDQAAVALEDAGAGALPFLRAAAKSKDAEVARRAAIIIAATEEKLLTAALLTPRRFRLAVHDAPIADAVAELSRQSGYAVKLDGVPPDRKITIDTGETTFWDALKQLCRAAELVDKQVAPPTPPPAAAAWSGRGPFRFKKGGLPVLPAELPPAAVQPAAQLPVELTAGEGEDLPTCQVGSVRIRILPPIAGNQAAPASEAQLVLEVTGEPRLRDFGVLGLQHLDVALDDRDQMLALSLHPNAAPAAPLNLAPGGGIVINANIGAKGNRIIINAGNRIIVNGYAVGGQSAPVAGRTVTLHLDRGAKSATKLRKLSGVLLVQGWNEPETLVSIDKILNATGHIAKTADGRTVEIRSVEKLPNRGIRIQMAGTIPDSGNAGGMFGNANIVINGMNLNNLNFGGTDPLTRCQPKLSDAAGKEYAMLEVADDQVEFANGKQVHAITYVFHPQAGQGDPVQLSFSSQRLVTFRVPFTLRDVPLP